MITVSLSLALCTVMFRRFMDSFTSRIPLAVQNGAGPNTTALFMLSGALYYLYSHLKKGTLVRIGQPSPRHITHNPSHTRMPRRPKNNSWFLRNARSCRKKCTDAMYRIAKQSYESLHNLNPCLLLPNKSFQICFTKVKSETNLPEKKNVCNIIYSNELFDKGSNAGLDTSERGFEPPAQPVQDNGTAVRKRGRKSGVKRLGEGLKLKEEFSVSQKWSKPIKRVTRSGKVYSLVE